MALSQDRVSQLVVEMIFVPVGGAWSCPTAVCIGGMYTRASSSGLSGCFEFSISSPCLEEMEGQGSSPWS